MTEEVNELDRLREENAQLRAELTAAIDDVSLLATALHSGYYQDQVPDFKLAETPSGILNQIAKMVTGICQLTAQVAHERDVNEHALAITTNALAEAAKGQAPREEPKPYWTSPVGGTA